MTYERAPQIAIKSFLEYKETHKNQIISPFFGKAKSKIIYEKPENATASPIISVAENVWTVTVENVDFEATECEAEAFFIFLGLHGLLGLKFESSIEKKVKSIMKAFF